MKFFAYSRLRSNKGITIVATYLFWIYHGETEEEFDFTGDRDIRRFLLDAQRAGLEVFIRIGPWAHGECRNGGLPDWLLQKPYKLRDNNREYMEKVQIWYEKIHEQVKGLFYRDGGNIIGIQRRQKITVSDGAGFIEISDVYDVAQIYADGELAADNFYYGIPWRIPARLLSGKECYLVMSEIKNDFYKEF